MRKQRKSSFTQELADTICRRLASGESLCQIERDPDMPPKSTILDWVNKYPSFTDQYARARATQLDHYAEEILDIADNASNDWMVREGKEALNAEHVQRSKLRIDTRKWLMGKLAPKKYGEKTELSVVKKSIEDYTDEELAAIAFSGGAVSNPTQGD